MLTTRTRLISRGELWGVVIALLLMLGPAPLWAGRPLDTEDTGTVEPGKAELELSADYANNPEDNTWGLKGVLSFGVLPRLEARVESALLLVEPDDQRSRAGIGDSLFGIKYRLLDEAETLPAVLGAFTLRLPTGDEERGLGDEDVDVGLLAVVSKAFGPLTLTWNGGYTFVTRDSDLDFWTFAGSIEYRVTKALVLVAEAVGTVGVESEPDTVVLRVGGVYAINDRVRLDGAVGFGANRASPDVVVTVGVTIALF